MTAVSQTLTPVMSAPAALLTHLTLSVAGVKEDFAPPLTGMPGQFPVYLRLPYRSDWYFCFKQQAKQAVFLSILLDCIRHQNQGENSFTRSACIPHKRLNA